jgi:hypothetical protein
MTFCIRIEMLDQRGRRRGHEHRPSIGSRGSFDGSGQCFVVGVADKNAE